MSQVTRRQQWKRRSRSSGLLRVVEFGGDDNEGRVEGERADSMVVGSWMDLFVAMEDAWWFWKPLVGFASALRSPCKSSQ